MQERLRELSVTQEARYVQHGQSKLWLQSHNLLAEGPQVQVLSGGPGYGLLDVIRFADTGYPTHLPDWEGIANGALDHPTDADYNRICTVENFVSQIGTVQDAIDAEKVVLIGHSSGGTFATLYALQNPDRVAGLVLVSPMLSGNRAVIDGETLIERIKPGAADEMRRMIREGKTDSDDYHAYEAEFAQRFLFGERLPMDALPKNLEESERKSNKIIYKRMVGDTEIIPDPNGPLLRLELFQRLKDIVQIPTVFIGGRNDLITPETLELAYAAMPGSELKIFEQSAHFPHETESEAVIAFVKDFVQRRVISQAA